LQEFFEDFLWLFDPQTAAGLDFSTVVFRNAEAFTDLPRGERRTADLVAEVRTLAGEPELILLHVEVQREREAGFPARMWQYYAVLRQRDGLLVIPIAVVFYLAREAIAMEEYEEGVLGRVYLTFRYLQISLPLLAAEDYVAAERPLGVALAPLMRLPDTGRAARLSLYLACMRRINQGADSGELNDARAFLLWNMVNTYLPLSDDDRAELQARLTSRGDTTLETTELTYADRLLQRGHKEGREEGREEGYRESVRTAIQLRFTSVPAALDQALPAMSRDELTALLRRVLTVQRVEDLL